MEEVSEEMGPLGSSFSFGESLGRASTEWRSSPEQQAPVRAEEEEKRGADWYDLASNTSSDGSWWKDDNCMVVALLGWRLGSGSVQLGLCDEI